MSARPQSVNDEAPVAKRLRRDQIRRCQTIIDVNRAFPEISFGLIRDYLKGNPDVESIYFNEERTHIVIRTRWFNGIGGTEYFLKLQRPIRLETPTLD
jgi:hypothetical protein